MNTILQTGRETLPRSHDGYGLIVGFQVLVPSRVDGERGDHFLQADVPGLIRTTPNWITSESSIQS
jgi:hypothetical protein